MNSDHHENAAWRTFGMLDADETASFDQALREDPELEKAYREINSLTAAIAAATAAPLAPRAGQRDRLHTRLGLNPAKHTNWLGISGWAAAAALTAILLIQREPAAQNRTPKLAQQLPPIPNVTGNPQEKPSPDPASADQVPLPPFGAPSSSGNAEVAGIRDTEGRTISKIETRRLIQEIEVLREKLQGAAERDKQRFHAVAGMSWPIVMCMSPPATIRKDSPSLALADNEPPITSILGDALMGETTLSGGNFLAKQDIIASLARLAATDAPVEISPSPLAQVAGGPALSAKMSAMPIYDAARDTGTLVVCNLPEKNPDQSYNLWVTTEDGKTPIHVGELPEAASGATESFDFSLGASAIVPIGFSLTIDHSGIPLAPSAANTVLQGPQ